MEIAKRIGAEIINADSQQVYRYFDIGTAKPTPEQLALVPHHLISIIEPDAGFSVAEFQRRADQAIGQIHAKGRPILVVGGTGLYVRALLHGVVPVPGADPALRARLEAEAKADGGSGLYRRLEKIDPESAGEIQPADLVRIIRALEIFERTGTPASRLRRQHQFSEQRYPFSLVVLSPPRDVLYRAIEARTRAMFANGLVEEVGALVKSGFRDAAPMKSVGYAQALAVHDGTMSPDEAIAAAQMETRRYAKRQMTWFRKEAGARFIAPPYPVDLEKQ
jgi:tRNA dimethylallyltransferase